MPVIGRAVHSTDSSILSIFDVAIHISSSSGVSATPTCLHMSRVLRKRSPQRTDVIELEVDKILMSIPGEPVDVRVELYIHISASPPVPEPL